MSVKNKNLARCCDPHVNLDVVASQNTRNYFSVPHAIVRAHL